MLWLQTVFFFFFFFFFFPVVHAPFEKWISWPRTNAASQTCTCFSAPLWETERYFSKSYLIKACDFSSPPLLFLFAVCYWQAFLFHWGGCSGEWQSLVRHVGGHVSIESHNAVHFTEFFFPVKALSLAQRRRPPPPKKTKKKNCWTIAPPVDCQKQVCKSANIWPRSFWLFFADCWFSEMHI